MHEQKHNEPGTEQQTEDFSSGANGNKPTREEQIRLIAEPMQEYALANPILTHAAHAEAARKSDFSKFLEIKNTVVLHVRLTISPSDDDAAQPPFWHCSMSLISPASGRAKSYVLWTRRERDFVRELLPKFLGKRGMKHLQSFTNTKTALHCQRDLSPEEMANISWESSESPTATVVIIGQIPCCICGEAMSQRDVDAGEAILSGSETQFVTTIIAHVKHFYVKKNNHAGTADYKLNMAKFALAVGRENGISPEQEQTALAKIAEMEVEVGV